MATGSGWQQYYCPAAQGKFSSSSASSSVSFQAGIAMEYTQDLHLKMSKKIAQLTKGFCLGEKAASLRTAGHMQTPNLEEGLSLMEEGSRLHPSLFTCLYRCNYTPNHPTRSPKYIPTLNRRLWNLQLELRLKRCRPPPTLRWDRFGSLAQEISRKRSRNDGPPSPAARFRIFQLGSVMVELDGTLLPKAPAQPQPVLGGANTTTEHPVISCRIKSRLREEEEDVPAREGERGLKPSHPSVGLIRSVSGEPGTFSSSTSALVHVIYALNTKNDEHEAAIATLKEAHEEEVQQILSETREKILQYKTKISDEMDLKRRIQSLEESMELHERMKRQALAEFESYRQRMEDMQLCTEAQHTQRVVSMSREVEEMRRSFEEKLRTFSQAQNQFEQEKKVALEELKGQHRQEVQELLRSHQSQNANYSKDQEKLVQLHKAEVDSLSERVDELKQDKKRLVEEYEAKLSKAQAFYERELEAMKRTQQMTADNLLAWKRTEAELRREFQAQEAALQKTLGKLRAELAKVTDEARENRDKSHKLQASLTAAENSVKDLIKKLDEVTQNSEIVEIRQKESECELEAARDRVQQQATEILLKAS
ncbi:unnamed protein product, partial [Tetraodon nigroviridis]